MQLEKEFKNMESNIVIFSFAKENKCIELELDAPNFSEFVKKIIIGNYEVSDDNISVVFKGPDNKNIDIETLKSIVIEVHQSYFEELNKFYENINKELMTYYSDDEELIKTIEEYIQTISKSNFEKNEEWI